jgi:hypothetical protein
VHYPIKLALTVHKSSRLTFDKAAMLKGFMPQAYVAIAFALLRRSYFAFSAANKFRMIKDVMDYALNKASSC